MMDLSDSDLQALALHSMANRIETGSPDLSAEDLKIRWISLTEQERKKHFAHSCRLSKDQLAIVERLRGLANGVRRTK